MKLNIEQLKVGDRLVRTKGGIFSRHHVLYAGIDPDTHEHIVVENQRGYGVRIITLHQFLNEGRLSRVDYNDYSLHEQRNIQQRIRERLGRNYHLLNYNCEQFVNDVLHNEPTSRQIMNGTRVLFALGSLFLAARVR